MLKDVHYQVVFEGIENQEQLELAASYGCDTRGIACPKIINTDQKAFFPETAYGFDDTGKAFITALLSWHRNL